MAEVPYSPEARATQRKKKITLDRTRRLKGSLAAWSTALVVVSTETFLFKGFFGSRILPFVPDEVLYWCECGLVAYVLSALIYLAISMFFGAPELLSVFLPKVTSPAQQRPNLRSPNLNESRRSNKSWVEDIQFGTPSEKSICSPSFNIGSAKSPLRDTSMNTSDILAGYIGSPLGKSTPHSKPVDSIHTREQLDRYLRKESEQSFLDVSASSALGGSFTYFNMLDLSGGDRKPYQISEKNAERTESKENVSVLRLPTDRRVHLSTLGAAENDADALAQLRTVLLAAKEPKKTAGSPLLRRDSIIDRRRRSSHSSPTPQLGSHSIADTESTGSLEEIDLSKSEHKLRAWIVKAILIPLRDQIKKTNIVLEKEHANPPLRIGVSSVEALKSALSSRDSLRTTLLPFILPFLSIHSNQGYLVSRINELAADPFMVNYNWNAGGSEPEEKAVSVNCRISRKRWHDGLPTDAELLFNLFSVFMDYQLTSNPLVGTSLLNKPFTAVYTVTTKPNVLHCAAGSFYIHLTSTAPPHFDFVYVTEGGRIPMKTSITKGSVNLFYAILHFIHHAKTQNAGKIDMVSIGRTGLGIGSVLE